MCAFKMVRTDEKTSSWLSLCISGFCLFCAFKPDFTFFINFFFFFETTNIFHYTFSWSFFSWLPLARSQINQMKNTLRKKKTLDEEKNYQSNKNALLYIFIWWYLMQTESYKWKCLQLESQQNKKDTPTQIDVEKRSISVFVRRNWYDF